MPRAWANAVLAAVQELQRRIGAANGLAGGGAVDLLVTAVTPDHDAGIGDVLAPAGRVMDVDGGEWQPGIKVGKPDAGEMNVVVMLDAVNAGFTGVAATAGLVWCPVDIQDAKHRFVKIGDDGLPVSDDAGWGYIVDPKPDADDHPGTGKRPCLVRFPVGGGGGGDLDELLYMRAAGSGGKAVANVLELDADHAKTPSNFWAAEAVEGYYTIGTAPING